MSSYTISDSARRDVGEIWEYIASDNADAADRMVDRFYERIELVADSPYLGAVFPTFGETIRHTTVGKYVIFYEARHTEIHVLRVLHGARDFATIFENEPLEDS